MTAIAAASLRPAGGDSEPAASLPPLATKPRERRIKQRSAMPASERIDYAEFLAAKTPRNDWNGLTKVGALPSALKPFQRAIVEWALRRCRAAMFEGTGLGKTIQQLSWARAVADHELEKF